MKLTPTEQRIVDLWFQGRTSDAAVATALGVCVQTVKEHHRNIYRKLGALNKAHAAALAFQAGVVHV